MQVIVPAICTEVILWAMGRARGGWRTAAVVMLVFALSCTRKGKDKPADDANQPSVDPVWADVLPAKRETAWFVAVRGRAPLYAQPKESAHHFSGDSIDRPRLFRLIRDAGEWVQVETVGYEPESVVIRTEPHPSDARVITCIEPPAGFVSLRIRLFVRRKDLHKVTTRRLQVPFGDGSRLVLSAGVPIGPKTPGSARRRVYAPRSSIEASIPDDGLGHKFEAVVEPILGRREVPPVDESDAGSAGKERPQARTAKHVSSYLRRLAKPEIDGVEIGIRVTTPGVRRAATIIRSRGPRRLVEVDLGGPLRPCGAARVWVAAKELTAKLRYRERVHLSRRERSGGHGAPWARRGAWLYWALDGAPAGYVLSPTRIGPVVGPKNGAVCFFREVDWLGPGVDGTKRAALCVYERAVSDTSSDEAVPQ